MDSENLKKLGEELAKILDCEGHPLFEIKVQIARLISHLESEQRVTVRMEKQMDIHEKALFGDKANLAANPGIVPGVHSLLERQNENKRRHNAVLVSVVTLIILEGLKLIVPHIK